jgi:CheY-like chemotaxis protein
MERIRRLPDARPVLAVALTALARAEDRTRALLAGFQAYLTKPIESDQLLATAASFAKLLTAQRRSGL